MARTQESQPVVGGSVNPMVMESLAGQKNRMIASIAESGANRRASEQAGVQREGIAAQRAMQAERIAADDRRQAAEIESRRKDREATEHLQQLSHRFQSDEARLEREFQEATQRGEWDRQDKTLAQLERINKYNRSMELRQSALNRIIGRNAVKQIVGEETSRQMEIDRLQQSAERAEATRKMWESNSKIATEYIEADPLLSASVLSSGYDVAETLATAFNTIARGMKAPELAKGDWSRGQFDRVAKDWTIEEYGKVRAITDQMIAYMDKRLDSATSEGEKKALEARRGTLRGWRRALNTLRESDVIGRGGKPLGEMIQGYEKDVSGATGDEIDAAISRMGMKNPEQYEEALWKIISGELLTPEEDALLYQLGDTGDPQLNEELNRDMREWMKARGVGPKPAQQKPSVGAPAGMMTEPWMGPGGQR